MSIKYYKEQGDLRYAVDRHTEVTNNDNNPISMWTIYDDKTMSDGPMN
jgi:hypothetical protein